MGHAPHDAILLLEDGHVFRGQGWGEPSTVAGELVFNTAHTGYEEVLTDPSYAGQIVVFTTSHLGNTGITGVDAESSRMFAEGFVCKEFTRAPDNQRALLPLERYLERQGKCAISGLDTRALTRRLREKGCLRALLTVTPGGRGPNLLELKERLERFRQKPLPAVLHGSQAGYEGPHLPISEECLRRMASHAAVKKGWLSGPRRVAVIDFGIKKGIAQHLVSEGLEPHFFSPFARVGDIEAIRPDGLFLSNGPGDPRDVLAQTPLGSLLEDLTPRLPTFGICMGHQVLALRYGARIRKLKFGHHAVNHPVREVARGHVGYITSQNHNFVAEVGDVSTLEVTHVHLNDGTVAGLRHLTHPVFSVQFHPECNPGPHDAWGLFSRFADAMGRRIPA
jgi:carbamoyl-phosphate synthase small subunit